MSFISWFLKDIFGISLTFFYPYMYKLRKNTNLANLVKYSSEK